MTDRPTDSADKQSAALWSVAASAGLTLMKLVVGLLTGSIGILSEAAHSALDCGSTIITLAAVRIGDRPADRNHPYGHGKVESIAALIETGLLFVTSAGIVFAAGERLASGAPPIEASPAAIGVMALSIAVDWVRARRLSAVAKQTDSKALEADALHFSSDMLSSAVVLAGLGFVHFGYPAGDPIAAIGVAGFVCRAGWRLGKQTIETLIDTAPAGIVETVTAIARATPGIARVDRVRGGPRGSAVYVDISAAVGRTLSLDQVGAIKDELKRRVRTSLPGAHVLVETHPLALDDETILERVQVIAAAQGVPVHHITVQHVGERISVSFDIELDGTMPMRRAHAIASEVEAALRAEFGEGVEVESHIEPLLADPLEGEDVAPGRLAELASRIDALALPIAGVGGIHGVRARATSKGLFVSLHCRVADDASVEACHDSVTRLEHAIRSAIPDIGRIIAHAEPASADDSPAG